VKTVKMRTIKVSSHFLLERLQGKPTTQNLNLPSDTELLYIKYDMLSGQVLALVRSDTFEDIADTYPIPEIAQVNMPKPVLSATPAQKTETKTMLTFKSENTVPKKILVSQKPKSNTGLMEEEFNADQRKLLSFSMDGDFVVVKPVKFLKAEWDDINEVVRSLGGRWVKGDIISYWEIPLKQN
jgi:hypothetical protein